MFFKVVALLLFLLVVFATGLLSEKPEEGPRPLPRYKGPKSDERIDRMLAESMALLKGLGVPISDSISPVVVLNGSHANYGVCCPKGSKKKYSEYDYYIEISGFTVDNSDRCLRNTLIHELIHTVPGGHGHTGEWKKWAKFVSERTGYHIQRIGGGDDTELDESNLRRGGAELPKHI